MNPLTEKVLRSGLIDKAMVELLEKSGSLPEGSTDKVKEDALKDASIGVLTRLADDMAVLMEREQKIRETYLDLKNLKWPAVIWIGTSSGASRASGPFTAMMDGMGRYFIRFQDAKKEDFVIGAPVRRERGQEIVVDGPEEILSECQVLYVDQKPVCYQLSVASERFRIP